MSIFNEILPKLIEISNNTVKNFNDELRAALDCLDKFEGDYLNGRGGARDKAQREKALTTTLQSIHEDDDETNKPPDVAVSTKPDEKPADNEKRRASKKRSKDEVEGMLSPEQDKRAKRNASVKAQTIISKQGEREILKALNEEGIAFVSSTKSVNVNLTAKMRREDTSLADKKSRRRKEGDKENAEPVPAIQIKQEKISLLPEPMDTESLPVNIDVKEEPNKDESAMPPPAAPVAKARKTLKEKEKKKDKEDDSAASDNEESGRRRTTKTRKQTDMMPPPSAPAPVASARATRASRRASSRAPRQPDTEDEPKPAARPKRTRGRKKLSESSTEPEKTSTQASEEITPASPVDKPRPKRTRRGRNAEKEADTQKQQEPQTVNQKEPTVAQISPKEERISQPESPVFQKTKKGEQKKTAKSKKAQNTEDSVQITDETDSSKTLVVESIDKQANMNMTVTINNDMDKTMVLPNGVYNHAPITPKSMRVNETMVLESNCRETMILDKHNIKDVTVVIEKLITQTNINDATIVVDKDIKKTNINDATVVIEKDNKQTNVVTSTVDDNDSLLTDDASEPEVVNEPTPPRSIPPAQPTSAVKEKVQQFEELAARTTRTKTRAMAKMQQEEPDTHTPPDKMIKPGLSQDTLNKMNSIIFNGKPPQVTSSASASKPRAIPVPVKPNQPATTSKLSSLNKHKEAAEREKEDARKKKEALLEAKREQQKKKREEKMANAAAAREAADRERKLAMEAAVKERLEKQLHADQGKLERLKEAERKKLELARKVAETEERRRAEEAARRERLAQEQRKAEAARRKQLEETEAMKKEAAQAKEIEKKNKEYLEKQKMKQRLEDKLNTPLKMPGTPGYHAQEPVYMADGFQFLNSDEEDEPITRPVPAWSSSKARKHVLVYQSQISQSHIDALFSVRVHSPDLREIFPSIERARCKRTSSAVWRTPPRLPPLQE